DLRDGDLQGRFSRRRALHCARVIDDAPGWTFPPAFPSTTATLDLADEIVPGERPEVVARGTRRLPQYLGERARCLRALLSEDVEDPDTRRVRQGPERTGIQNPASAVDGSLLVLGHNAKISLQS